MRDHVLLRFSHGKPSAFVMPGTSQDMLATRWGCGDNTQIIIVQQDPNVDYSKATVGNSKPEFHNGEPAIIVPLTSKRAGDRTVWIKWEPDLRREGLQIQGTRALENKTAAGLLVHLTQVNDKSYMENPEVFRRRGLPMPKSKGAAQPTKKPPSTNKRKRPENPPGDDTNDEGRKSLLKFSAALSIRPPTPSTLLLIEDSPGAARTPSHKQAVFKFNDQSVDVDDIETYQQFFEFALAYSVTTKSTSLLCATFGGQEFYALLGYPDVFETQVLPLIEKVPKGEGDDEGLPQEVVVTAIVGG